MTIKKIRPFIVFILIFVITISYVDKFGLGLWKWMCVVATCIFPIIYIVWDGGKIKGSALISLLLLTGSSIFQPITNLQKITAFVYYVVLILWIEYGDTVLAGKREFVAAAFAIATATGIGLMNSEQEFIAQRENIYNGRHRLWGAFSHPNHLGSMAVMLIVLIFSSFYLYRETITYIQLIVGSIFLIYAGWILTLVKSRTSFILVGIFFLVIIAGWINRFDSASKAILLIALLFLGAVFCYFFMKMFVLKVDTFQSRLAVFRLASFDPKRFLFGYGMVSSSQLNVGEQYIGTLEIAWVMMFFKNGIVGVGVLLFYFLKLIHKALTVIDKKRRILSLAVIAIMIASTLGEAYVVNITNLFSVVGWMLASSLTSDETNLLVNRKL